MESASQRSEESPNEKWRRRRQEFSDMSTLHGLKRALDDTGKLSAFRQSVWALLMVVGLGLIMVITFDQVDEYRNHPTSTRMSIKQSSTPQKFPAVTLCSLNRFYNYTDVEPSDEYRTFMDAYDLAELTFSENVKFSALEKGILKTITTGMNATTKSKFISAYRTCEMPAFGSIADSSRKWLVSVLLLSKCSNVYEKNISQRNSTINLNSGMKNILENYGFSLNRSLVLCDFGNGRRRKCSADDFVPLYSTRYGLCWTFNSEKSHQPSWYQTHDGIAAGLRLVLKNPQHQFIRKRMKQSLSGAGLKITLHDPKDSPDVDESGFFVGPGFHSFAEIEMTKEEHAKPPWGKCVNNKNYTRNIAEHTCLRDLCLANCGCVPSTYANQSVEICGPPKLTFCLHKLKWNSVDKNVTANEQLLTKQWENCHAESPCTVVKFKESVSSVVWPSFPDINSEKLEGVLRDDLKQDYMVLDIFYPELTYLHIQEISLVNFRNLISKFGGTLGLFLGASLLTLMEMVELIIFYFARLMESSKRNMGEWRRLT